MTCWGDGKLNYKTRTKIVTTNFLAQFNWQWQLQHRITNTTTKCILQLYSKWKGKSHPLQLHIETKQTIQDTQEPIVRWIFSVGFEMYLGLPNRELEWHWKRRNGNRGTPFRYVTGKNVLIILSKRENIIVLTFLWTTALHLIIRVPTDFFKGDQFLHGLKKSFRDQKLLQEFTVKNH